MNRPLAIGHRRARVAAACAAACLLAGCQQKTAMAVADGDADRGAVAIDRAQCGACHEIPGIPNAHGLVGPPLARFGDRTIVAGLLPNTPDNLVHWLRDPQSVTPGNAMPSTGLNEQQARDVAAYLYTLR